ncbi:MAG: PH domain-containing protein, partial [Patescibacteria group bacterium]
EVSEFTLNKVQDVTVTVKGFLPTLMRFGDVDVKTASQTKTLILRNIPEPYKIQDLIIQLSQGQNKV